MSDKNNGGPAFPSLEYSAVENGEESGHYASFDGMTLRDYFAAKAMQAMLSINMCYTDLDDYTLSKQAYGQADAMLSERDK